MTEHDDDLDIVLRPWMHQHAPDAPSDLVLRIYGEIETMSQQPQTHRWLSRFTVWPIGAWAATIAVVAILAVAGGLFLTSIGRLSLVGDQPTPTTSSSSADPTTVADALIAAWNSGDGQQAASLYSFPQPQTQPIARFFVDSSFGDATQSYATASNIADAVGAWHAIGSTLTRTGDVLIQGPFAAYPVTWTSSDGSYNGVEVLRISTDGLVTDQYLFGASSATATGAPVDAAQLIGALRDAQNSSDGSAASSLLAPTVRASAFRDGAKDFGPLNLDDLTSSISQGTACCVTDTGGFETQGPFIVHMTTVTNATQLQGARVDGAEILQLNGDGQIAYVWRIDTLIDLASSTPTSMPSAAVSADPTAVAHDLIAAWNAGDGQQATGLYDSSVPASQPIGRFMVDSGATTQTACSWEEPSTRRLRRSGPS